MYFFYAEVPAWKSCSILNIFILKSSSEKNGCSEK